MGRQPHGGPRGCDLGDARRRIELRERQQPPDRIGFFLKTLVGVPDLKVALRGLLGLEHQKTRRLRIPHHTRPPPDAALKRCRRRERHSLGTKAVRSLARRRLAGIERRAQFQRELVALLPTGGEAYAGRRLPLHPETYRIGIGDGIEPALARVAVTVIGCE